MSLQFPFFRGFLSWRYWSRYEFVLTGLLCIYVIPDISKQNESWKSGQRRLWNLMNIWKLHAICNGGQKHIRSNLMIMTKKHCGSHPLISCLWHFCSESAHRNHNGYKGWVYSARLLEKNKRQKTCDKQFLAYKCLKEPRRTLSHTSDSNLPCSTQPCYKSPSHGEDKQGHHDVKPHCHQRWMYLTFNPSVIPEACLSAWQDLIRRSASGWLSFGSVSWDFFSN